MMTADPPTLSRWESEEALAWDELQDTQARLDRARHQHRAQAMQIKREVARARERHDKTMRIVTRLHRRVR